MDTYFGEATSMKPLKIQHGRGDFKTGVGKYEYKKKQDRGSQIQLLSLDFETALRSLIQRMSLSHLSSWAVERYSHGSKLLQ